MTDDIYSEDRRSSLFHTNPYDREIVDVLIEDMIQEKNRDMEIKLLLKERIEYLKKA